MNKAINLLEMLLESAKEDLIKEDSWNVEWRKGRIKGIELSIKTLTDRIIDKEEERER